MSRSSGIATALGLLLIAPALALALHGTAIWPLSWTDQPLGEWQPESGHGFAVPLNTLWMSRREVGESPAVVLEDGVPLSCSNIPEELIAEKGSGRYLVANGFLYLSASDNSDPRTNHRNYVLRWPARPSWLVVSFAGLAALGGLAWLLMTWRAELASAILAPPLSLCFLVVIVPFVLHRAWFFLHVPLPDIQYDTTSYYVAARDVLLGRWPHFEIRPPGYPLALAAVLGSHLGLLSVTVLQSLATLGSAFVVICAVYRLQRSLALWVALALVAHVTRFWTINLDTAILSESLYTSALILSVGLLLLSFQSPRVGWLVAASASMAAAILIRPAGLFLIVIVMLICGYLAWNRRGWRRVAAFGVPFVALLLATSIYNNVIMRGFAVTAAAEENLLGATSRIWETDPAYPPEINQAIAKVKEIVAMSDEERQVVDTSWSPTRLAPIFYRGYSLPAATIAERMAGNATASRAWMRRVSLAAIRRRPDVYAKFVTAMSYQFFVENIYWRADFADYIGVRALHILHDTAREERRARPDEDELVARYLDLSRVTGLQVNDVCVGPDRVGRLVPSTLLRVHRLTQRARDLVAARTAWVAVFGMVMLGAVWQLIRHRGRHDAAFLLFVIGLFPLGAGAVVCLIEVGAGRYSYPTEFGYYLVVAMAPLLWNERVRA